MEQITAGTAVEEINLCNELITLMKKMEFKKEAIDAVIVSEEFNFALGSPVGIQRTNLILYLNNLFLLSGEPVPNNVRRALTISLVPIDWLSDMATVVLQYLKLNQDFYFPTIN